jgi:hypothetical protein
VIASAIRILLNKNSRLDIAQASKMMHFTHATAWLSASHAMDGIVYFRIPMQQNTQWIITTNSPKGSDHEFYHLSLTVRCVNGR